MHVALENPLRNRNQAQISEWVSKRSFVNPTDAENSSKRFRGFKQHCIGAKPIPAIRTLPSLRTPPKGLVFFYTTVTKSASQQRLPNLVHKEVHTFLPAAEVH